MLLQMGEGRFREKLLSCDLVNHFKTPMRETEALGKELGTKQALGTPHVQYPTVLIHPFKHLIRVIHGADTALGGPKSHATCSPPKGGHHLEGRKLETGNWLIVTPWSVYIFTVTLDQLNMVGLQCEHLLLLLSTTKCKKIKPTFNGCEELQGNTCLFSYLLSSVVAELRACAC